MMNSSGDNNVADGVLAMSEELKKRLSTLGKMEKRTAEFFYERGIIDEFQWPPTNKRKDEAQNKRKLNSNHNFHIYRNKKAKCNTSQ